MLFIVNHQGRILARADLHVDVLLLSLNKTYGGHFSSLLNPDQHELGPLDGYVGDWTIWQFYVAQFFKRHCVKSEEVASARTNKDVAVVIRAVGATSDLAFRLKQFNLGFKSLLTVVEQKVRHLFLFPHESACEENFSRKDLLRPLLSIKLSVLPVKLWDQNLVHREYLILWYEQLEVYDVVKRAIDPKDWDTGCALVGSQNMPSVVEYCFELGHGSSNFLQQFNPGSLDQISELIIDTVLRIEVKLLQRLYIF